MNTASTTELLENEFCDNKTRGMASSKDQKSTFSLVFGKLVAHILSFFVNENIKVQIPY